MPYKTLGSRAASGAADTTGRNKGNWTVTFDPALIGIMQTEFECYKIVVTGAAAGATFNVYIDNQLWDTNVFAVNNSWDPVQPLLLRSGQSVFFFYTSAATDGSQPKVTAWFRYEVALSAVFGG